jgi:hypothetical protein
MASHKQISKIFQDVIKQFESFEGLRQCNGNKMVQQEIVDYMLVLGRLFTIVILPRNCGHQVKSL